jgi:hypothetical protein
VAGLGGALRIVLEIASGGLPTLGGDFALLLFAHRGKTPMGRPGRFMLGMLSHFALLSLAIGGHVTADPLTSRPWRYALAVWSCPLQILSAVSLRGFRLHFPWAISMRKMPSPDENRAPGKVLALTAGTQLSVHSC